MASSLKFLIFCLVAFGIGYGVVWSLAVLQPEPSEITKPVEVSPKAQ